MRRTVLGGAGGGKEQGVEDGKKEACSGSGGAASGCEGPELPGGGMQCCYGHVGDGTMEATVSERGQVRQRAAAQYDTEWNGAE